MRELVRDTLVKTGNSGRRDYGASAETDRKQTAQMKDAVKATLTRCLMINTRPAYRFKITETDHRVFHRLQLPVLQAF